MRLPFSVSSRTNVRTGHNTNAGYCGASLSELMLHIQLDYILLDKCIALSGEPEQEVHVQ